MSDEKKELNNKRISQELDKAMYLRKKLAEYREAKRQSSKEEQDEQPGASDMGDTRKK